MHTVKWFQVLLSNTNSFICTQLKGFKYCFSTLIILFNITHPIKCLNSSSWPIDETLTGTTTPGQSGPKSNSNEEVLQIPQSSRTEISPSDCLMGGGLTPLPKWSLRILQPQPIKVVLYPIYIDSGIVVS